MTTIDVARYPRVPDGPLAELVHPFRLEMIRLGYTARTAQDHAYVLACLSRWLDRTDLAPQRLGAAEMEEFVRYRRDVEYRRWLSVGSLREIVAYCGRSVQSRLGGRCRPTTRSPGWSSDTPATCGTNAGWAKRR
ncbi:MAG TPA: hypothetical protein VFC00_16620 [Micromonosporaceae bacterium]|nr:hypothetical protein [Micromonosporaceae bacterium]